MTRLIVVAEPTMNGGGKKRYSLPAQEMPIEKKLKTSSAALEDPSVADKPMIGLTSSNGKENEAARSEPRRLLGTKFSSPLERLVIMKSDKVESVAKVAPRPTCYRD